jgi:hypothetical protein
MAATQSFALLHSLRGIRITFLDCLALASLFTFHLLSLRCTRKTMTPSFTLLRRYVGRLPQRTLLLKNAKGNGFLYRTRSLHTSAGLQDIRNCNRAELIGVLQFPDTPESIGQRLVLGALRSTISATIVLIV